MRYYNLLNWARRSLWSRPRLYRPLGAVRRKRDVLDLDYDFTIEGYPRSANTFVSQLVKITNPHLKVRSHCHIPAFTIEAIRASLPVLFLVREPTDCASSYAIMCGTPILPQLVYYVAYHEVMQGYQDGMFIVDFKEVVEDSGSVLRRFGEQYSLPLTVDFDVDELSQQVFRRIEEENACPQGELNERHVHRPSTARIPMKAKLIAELAAPECRFWLKQANALYARFQSRALQLSGVSLLLSSAFEHV